MAQVEESQTEGEGSPQLISLRSDISGNHMDDGEVGPSIRRKRRKKKDPRPESIIVYRSEMERAPGEDQGGEDGAERSTEEGAKFLCTPTGEGGWSLPPDSRYVTLTGTITRGKKKGQVVDIHLTLTKKELRDLAKSKERLDAECEAGEGSKRNCSLGVCQGPHVVLWSLSCAPRTFWHKITICPFLIIFYPMLIMPMALSLALYSAVVQVSWAFSEWWQAVRDLEKGFCGWACGKLGLEDCSPYSIVELLDSDTVSGTLQSKAPSELAQTSSV
ncbi:hypothetical protein EPR50_G00119090 [Perca flavescens]|uniref:Transmembrane protein 169 n=1 Tax=Perca flavescens TaxID=8167 RepID=A0A484CVQ0_PERFV|nr:hypothetical protein EPR50_G00119090 [Perca flavescens]